MIASIVILIVTVLSSLLFVIFLATSSKYNQYIDTIDEKEFPVKSIYGAGFLLAEKLKIDYKSKFANDLRQQVVILYGEKYSEFFVRVLYAQKFSTCWLVLVASGIFSCFAQGSDSLVIFGLGLVMVGVVYYYMNTLAANKIKKKSAIYLKDFPGVVSTIALLVNAGMMLREAWTEVAYSSSGDLYAQMQRVSEDMDNGVSESDALYAFSLRCATPEIKKFTSFIVQGLEKGNKDLAFSLKNQSDELWEIKKQNVLQQGDLAASKLLIPIMVMFIGILVIVMGPIMTNIGL